MITNERLALTAIAFGFMGAFIGSIINAAIVGSQLDLIIFFVYVIGMFISCWKIIQLNDKEYKKYFKLGNKDETS